LPAPVTDVAGTEDGALLAASTSRGDVFRWTGAGRPVGGRLAVTDDTVWAVALSADGAALATAGADEVLSLWSPAGVSRPGRRHDLGSHRGGALDTTFVDPATVAAATGEGRVQLWDAGAGEPLGPALPVSAAPVRHLAAGPDGSLWAAAGDGTVSRIDALSLPAACAAAGPSFDDRQRARLLGGRAPLACPPGGRR
jgi:WD40 repeat protein